METVITIALGVALGLLVAASVVWFVFRFGASIGHGVASATRFSASKLYRSRFDILGVTLVLIASLIIVAVSQNPKLSKYRSYNQDFSYVFKERGEFDPNLNPFEQIRGTDLDPYYRSFFLIRNQEEFDQRAKRVRQEIKARQVLERADFWPSLSAQLLAIVLSPFLILLALIGGWRSPTIGWAMFWGLSGALAHDFLKAVRLLTEPFPTSSFPLALVVGFALAILAYLISSRIRNRPSGIIAWGISPENTPVRVIVYIIVLGVIGWFVWRFYIEPKVHTATARAVETTPAPAEAAPPATAEARTEPAPEANATAPIRLMTPFEP